MHLKLSDALTSSVPLPMIDRKPVTNDDLVDLLHRRGAALLECDAKLGQIKHLDKGQK